MKYAIFVDGDITVSELSRVFREAGYHLMSDAAGRLVAARVPAFLRPDPPASNVRTLPTARAKVRR